jgi:hypothetical protein
MQSHFPIHYHAPVLHCHPPSFLADTIHSLLSVGSPRNSCETLLFRELNFFLVPRCKLAKFWTSEPERASEGWLLLNVENEASGDSWSINERGPSLVGSLGSSCWYNRFLSCLGCSGQASTKYYFPHRTLFHFISSHRPAAWPGSRAGSPVSVSLLRSNT